MEACWPSQAWGGLCLVLFDFWGAWEALEAWVEAMGDLRDLGSFWRPGDFRNLN